MNDISVFTFLGGAKTAETLSRIEREQKTQDQRKERLRQKDSRKTKKVFGISFYKYSK